MTSSCYGLTCAAGAKHRRACGGKSDCVKIAIEWPCSANSVRTDVRKRESRCQSLKFRTMCWGADIGAVHRVNHDRLRALDAADVEQRSQFHVRL